MSSDMESRMQDQVEGGIVAELEEENARLRADRDNWCDQCSERVKDWDEMRQECERLHALIAAKNDMLREVTEHLETDAIQPRGGLHQAMKKVLALTDAQQPAEQHDSDGWLQSGGLLYRLTDEQHPQNRDEINVTMTNGSRADEAREQRASEILRMLTRSSEQPQARPDAVQDLVDTLIDIFTSQGIDRPAVERVVRQALDVVQLQAQAEPEGEYPEPLSSFKEGQWWVKELDAWALTGTPDQKRAVAVVHHMLKSVVVTQAQAEPVAGEDK